MAASCAWRLGAWRFGAGFDRAILASLLTQLDGVRRIAIHALVQLGRLYAGRAIPVLARFAIQSRRLLKILRHAAAGFVQTGKLEAADAITAVVARLGEER